MKYLFFSLVFILPFFSFGQKYEIGFNVGTSNYFGDVSPRLTLLTTREAVGFFVKKNLNKYWAFRINYNRARITGADSFLKYNPLRNLSFTNNLNEFSGLFEFNYRPYALGSVPNKSTFYILVGLAITVHNPQATYQGITYNLRELTTEGQSKPYPNICVALPLGVGYKWDLSKTFVLSVEAGFRWAFTDYLDDVSTTYPELNGKLPIAAHMSDRSVELNDVPISTIKKQRGDANPYDWYLITGLHLAYRIKPSACYHF